MKIDTNDILKSILESLDHVDYIRPEEILRLTKIDPLSLGKWRVNAALRNIDAFYSAFDIKEGEPMYMLPADRVVIW